MVGAAFLHCCFLAAEGGSGSTHRARYAHVLEGPFLSDAPGEEYGGQAVASRLTLDEEVGSTTGNWSGHRVWPSALALIDHLHRTRGGKLVGLRVLEIGCGLPLVGAALAALGAEVCATDHPDALPQVEAVLLDEALPPSLRARLQGFTAAARARLRLRGLAWGKGGLAAASPAVDDFASLCGFSGPVDLLVGADLVYHHFPLEPLLETVTAVLRENGASAVLALQARRFPMVVALHDPQRLQGFLRSLAGHEGWEVVLSKPGPGSLAQQSQDGSSDGTVSTDGLVLATVSPQDARWRGRAPSRDAAEQPGWLPLRYTREELPAREGTEHAGGTGGTEVKLEL